MLKLLVTTLFLKSQISGGWGRKYLGYILISRIGWATEWSCLQTELPNAREKIKFLENVIYIYISKLFKSNKVQCPCLRHWSVFPDNLFVTNVQCGSVRYYAILHTVALLSNLARTKKNRRITFPSCPPLRPCLSISQLSHLIFITLIWSLDR